MGSVIKKRRKRMSKKKHRKLLRKTRHQRKESSGAVEASLKQNPVCLLEVCGIFAYCKEINEKYENRKSIDAKRRLCVRS